MQSIVDITPKSLERENLRAAQCQTSKHICGFYKSHQRNTMLLYHSMVASLDGALAIHDFIWTCCGAVDWVMVHQVVLSAWPHESNCWIGWIRRIRSCD